MSGPGGKWLAFVGQREAGLIAFIAAITLVVGFVDVGFLSPVVWSDIIVRCAPTAIVACGLMLVVVSGEIDISVGSSMAFLSVVMGRMISQDEAQLPLSIGIPATLLLGACIGWAIGITVTWGRVPSIIVTLGLLTSLRGITTLMTAGKNIDRLPPLLSRLAKQGLLGVPLGVGVAAVVIGVTYLLIHYLALGRRLYAIGSSVAAARVAGLPVNRLKTFAFAYTGFLTAVATVVDIPRLPKIESGIGAEFELLVVTCVVVGGVSISGGRGRLSGVLLAVLLMTMIRPVLTFLDIGEAGEKWTKAIQGAFIMLAIVSDRVVSLRRTEERSL